MSDEAELFQLTRTIDPSRPVGSIKQLWVATPLTSTRCDDGGRDDRELEPDLGLATGTRRSSLSFVGKEARDQAQRFGGRQRVAVTLSVLYRGPPDGKSSLSTLPFASRS